MSDQRLPTDAPPPPLSVDAIRFSRGVSEAEAFSISQRFHAVRNRASVLVASLDIRSSTTALLHTEDPERWAASLAGFIAAVRYDVQKSGGWFDKFTGDGAIVFWESADFSSRRLAAVLNVLFSWQVEFLRSALPNIRRSTGCVPEGFGLAIGLDMGTCLLTDLALPERTSRTDPDNPSRTIEIDYPVELRRPLYGVTVLGRAIVGACRLQAVAEPWTVLGGEQLTDLLQADPSQFQGRRHRLREIFVETKDLGGRRQHAYLIHNEIVDASVKQAVQWSESTNSMTDDLLPER